MLYHKEVYWPAPLNRLLPSGKMELRYSNHAREQCRDKYTDIPILKSIDISTGTVVECEIIGHKLTKFLWRTRLTDTLDVCMIIQPDGFVRTVWANRSNDRHRTLDHSKYERE